MAAQHPHRSPRFASPAVPALIPFALGDANVSVGAAGLVLAIVLLVAMLLTVVFIEIAGEHRQNVRNRRHHG